MKRIVVIAFLFILLILTGCGKNENTAVVDAQSSVAAENTDVSETVEATEGETEEQAAAPEDPTIEPAAPDGSETESIMVQFGFSFTPNRDDAGKSILNAVSVESFENSFTARSGNLMSKGITDRYIPELIIEDKPVLLSVEGMNDLRKINMDFYNENFRDLTDAVIKAYVEAEEVFSSTEFSTDGFPINYKDNMPSELHLDIDGTVVKLDVIECMLDETGFTSEPENMDDPESYSSVLTDIAISFSCKSEDLSAIRGYYLKIAERESANTEEPDLSSVEFNEALNIDLPENAEEGTLESDTDGSNGTSSQNTGIPGRWYPDALDNIDGLPEDYYLYIQFDEGGVGEILKGEITYPITYTYSGNKIKIQVPETGAKNEYSYEHGVLISDPAGYIYRRK